MNAFLRPQPDRFPIMQLESDRSLKHRLQRSFYTLCGHPSFHCPVCGYRGPFKHKKLTKDGTGTRLHTKCLGCGSKERHRVMYLWFNQTYPEPGDAGAALLHVAPEKFLRPCFRRHFANYHTCDLFMADVDYKEDLQALSFPDASYDVVVISRVLTCPPDLEACVRETRRVLRKGGIAMIAEIHTLDHTEEFGRFVGERHRRIGMDIIELYRKHFERVELVTSDRFPAEYQLHNRIAFGGAPKDDYPGAVRIPGLGFKDVLAVCYA